RQGVLRQACTGGVDQFGEVPPEHRHRLRPNLGPVATIVFGLWFTSDLPAKVGELSFKWVFGGVHNVSLHSWSIPDQRVSSEIGVSAGERVDSGFFLMT